MSWFYFRSGIGVAPDEELRWTLTSFSSSALADASVLLLLEGHLQQQQLPLQPRLCLQEGRSVPRFPQGLLSHGREGKEGTSVWVLGMDAPLLRAPAAQVGQGEPCEVQHGQFLPTPGEE